MFRFFPKILFISSIKFKKYSDRKDRQDKTLLHFVHDTVMTDLAPQVRKHNRGGPGTIKINEIC